MKKLIDENRLYLAMPPLFKIYNKNKSFYAFDENEKDKIVKKEFKTENFNITRFKGLGDASRKIKRNNYGSKEKKSYFN